MSRLTRALWVLMVLTAVLILGATPAFAVDEASDQAGQCDGYNDPANTKVDTSDGSIVLEVGLTICIKAGNGNTGLIETDGETTLAAYIEDSGLLNNGGQVPNVSNYVIYGQAAESPSASPSPSASEEATPTPEASTSATASAAATATASVAGATPTATREALGAVPNTAMDMSADQTARNLLIAVLIGAMVLMLWVRAGSLRKE